MDPNDSAVIPQRPLAPLCERCSGLALTPDRFRVCRDRTNRTNPKSHSRQATTSPFCLSSGTAPIRYPVKEARRCDCPLCVLILQAIGSFGERNLDVDNVVEFSVQWELDGPHVEDRAAFANTFRKLKVSWSRKESTARSHEERATINQSGLGYYVRSSWSWLSSWWWRGDETKNNEEVYLVSADPAAPATETGESSILKWLRMCEARPKNPHPLSQGEWRHRFHKLVESTYFGVVDVVEKRLCKLPMENGEPAKFVALSYVWGKESQRIHEATQTLGKNFSSRIKPGGLEKDWKCFPRTIRDALKLVEDLGGMSDVLGDEDKKTQPRLRYIWIDLLCIVQDRPRSWKYNAENMDLIYGNAAFTICAADGSNSNAGLLALSAKEKDQPRHAWITPEVKVKVLKSSETVINASEWNKRAWTFQERILSQRCVIFTARRLYFHCRQTSWSQDDNPGEAENGMASSWRVLFHRSYEDLERRPIRFYMTSVERYTGRNLSFAQDILSAFNGVSRLMEWYLCAELYFGLPTSHFDLALLWKPLAGKSRRRLASTRGYGSDDLEFPSWSWCGWMDAENPGKGAGVTYNADFLGGCLADIRDWLLNHTWIVWYVRDREGDLRPLWEGPTAPQSNRTTNVAPQWRGYKSRRRLGCDWVKDLDIEENAALGEKVDDYGRQLKKTWWRAVVPQETPFTRRFPDNPFGVRGPGLEGTNTYSKGHGGNGYHHLLTFGEMRLDHRPYQPILQFWTLKCEFRVLRDVSHPARDNLQRFHVADDSADRCGTVVIDKDWADENMEDGHPCTFIALSEAKCLTKEEEGNWTYYIPRAREDSEWCFFYVMALTMDVDRGVWERVGLGKVFQVAFQHGGCEWDEIILG